MTSISRHKLKKRKVGRVPDLDMQMLKDNLKRSYTERIRRHQIALETIEMLRKAKFL
jgi:hypothetical protein